ncbi:MAG TPA: hypothetical protein VMA31_00630 [Bryobacteraceae bacterium]|nr:hypothetical protein [Bryobacteraceae bacterium]
MNDPSIYWLSVMNIVLGLVVLVCCGALVVGVLQEIAARRRKRAELAALDREVSNLVASYDSHALHVPELGLTMADGGDPVDRKDER